MKKTLKLFPLLSVFFIFGCTSNIIEIQRYKLNIQDYAIGLKTKRKSADNKSAIIELRYGYNPEFMSEQQKESESHYKFSLLLRGWTKDSNTAFFVFEYLLDNFVYDDSNAFAKVEKSGFLGTDKKVIFNKSLEHKIDFENIPNTKGSISLCFMMPKINQSLSDYSPKLKIEMRFDKTEKGIKFST